MLRFLLPILLVSAFASQPELQFLSSEELHIATRSRLALEKADSLSGPWRTFFRATNALRQKNFSLALALYRQAGEELPSQQARIRLQRATCLLELGLSDSARSVLAHEDRSAPSFLQEEMQRSWTKLMLPDSLPDSLFLLRADTVLQRLSRNKSFANSIRLKSARRLKMPADSARRFRLLWPLVTNFPGTKVADSALSILQNKKGKLPVASLNMKISLASHFCAAGKNRKCISMEKALLKKLSGTKHKQAMTRLAKAHYKLGDGERAATLYKQVVDRYGKTPYLLLQIARSYRKAGNKSIANRWYGKFQKLYPHHKKTVEMIWTSAQKSEQKGQWKAASKKYGRIGNEFGKSRRSKWAGYRRGLVEYKARHYKKAIVFFDEVIATRSLLRPRTGAMFLKAEALHKLKQDSLARHWFLEAIRDFPVSYYAHMSRKSLVKYKLLPRDSVPAFELLRLSPDSLLRWLRVRSRGGLTDSSMWSPETALTIRRLLQAGFRSDARAAYSSLSVYWKKRFDFLYTFSTLFFEEGDLAESYRIARKLLVAMSRKELDSAPRKLLELFYPKPHYRFVVYHAAKANLDPLFILALMRQESTFDEEISSPAGAFGLMQIMPATGEFLAKREKIENFRPELLFNPLMAIRLGTRYLGDLKKKLGGEAWVLANYNAGPEPARRWKKALQNKAEEFRYEDVTYWETRGYIQRVLGNWWTYQEIYH